MIDFHTHLDLYPNALEIFPRVNSENCFTLAVTTSPHAWLASKKIFSGYDNIKVALGLHPEIVTEKWRIQVASAIYF
jgi:TatD DNase family protein